jgi:hypothetical protein
MTIRPPLLNPHVPSQAMTEALPSLADEARRYADLYTKPPRSDERTAAEVNHLSIGGVPCLSCYQAARHQDEEFAWSSLWVLHSCGHTMHTSYRGREENIPLTVGTLVCFDSRLWHWTTDGDGMLIVAFWDCDAEPARAQVVEAFEAMVVRKDR